VKTNELTWPNQFSSNYKKKALFLDRDGIINVDKSYVYRMEDIEWMPGIIELIQAANQRDFLVVVLTNQSGVARNYYTEADIHKLHQAMDQHLQACKAIVHKWYYCPHLEGPFRKPAPGMMIQAAHELTIDLSKSWMLGDKPSDVLDLAGPSYNLLRGHYPLVFNQDRDLQSINFFDDLYSFLDFFISKNEMISP